MSDFFNADNRFFTALGKLADLVILDVYFLLTVFLGIGPACTAMYYAAMKNIRKGRNYLTKCYFHSFRQNFRQGFIIGIIELLFGLALGYCYLFALQMNAANTLGQVYYWGIVVFICFFTMTFLYVYPLLSRYNLKVGQALKTAFLLGIKHFLTTIALLILFFLTVIGCYYFTFEVYTPVILILPSCYCLLSTFLIERTFRKSIPENDTPDSETLDAWWRDDEPAKKGAV